MANEITITLDMSRRHATNTADSHTWPALRKQYNQTGVGQDDRKHSIGTAEESITFTDITTNGFVLLQNLDTTNYVQWGFSTGVYGGRMRAGETAGPFRMEPGATLFLKSNTAACRVRAVHYED
jgi:hypothetical protein